MEITQQRAGMLWLVRTLLCSSIGLCNAVFRSGEAGK